MEESDVDIDQLDDPEWSDFEFVVLHSKCKLTEGWPEWFKQDTKEAVNEVKVRSYANKMISNYKAANLHERL